MKKLFLAAALLLCIAEGMAQKTIVKSGLSGNDSNGDKVYYYDLYSDNTAILKAIDPQCDYNFIIPDSIDYDGKKYGVVEVANNVFSGPYVSTVTIKALSLTLGKSPLGSESSILGTPELYVSPCIDVSNWKDDFTIQTLGLDNATVSEVTKSYDGTPDLDLSTNPCTVTTSDYTLSITKAKTYYAYDTWVNTNSNAYQMRAIDYSVINKNNEPACTVTDDDLVIDQEIVRITPADLVLSTDRIIALTDAKYYPSLDDNDNVKIISTHLVSDNSNVLFTYLTNECRFLQNNIDTAIVGCTVTLSAYGSDPCLLITIPQGASCSGIGANYNTSLTQDYEFKLKLTGDKVKLYLTDATIKHQVTPYCDGKFDSYALVSPGLFGSSVPTQAAVYTLPSSLESSLSKAYDNSATYTVSNLPDKITLHIAYDLNRYELENNLYKRYKNDAGTLSSLKTNYNIHQDRTIDIPVDAKLVFVDDNGAEDVSIGDNKKVKLVLTPTGSDADFYKALLENTIVLDGYSGSITPKQLSSDDIKGIENKIKSYISNPKFFDNTPNVNMSVASPFTYNIADNLAVTVTITDAKYYNKGAEVSEVGKNYDIKVSYKVDDNFYISTEQAGGYVRSQTLTLNNGAILSECSPDNTEIGDILADLERNSHFEDVYTGASSRERSVSQATASATYLVEVTGITTVDGDNNKAPVSDVKYDDNGNVTYWGMLMQYQIKDQSGNVCFDKNSTGYSDLYVQASGASTQSGKGFKITPAEFTVTASMFDGLFQTEKTYDGNTKVFDNSDEYISTTNPIAYTESDQTIFQITSAQYKDANAAEQKDITLTLSIVSTNYTLASNTFTLTNGKITPAEFTVTASMFDGLFQTEKTYDGNTNVYDNTDAINTNNPVDYKESGQTIFKVTSAQYKDANAAEQKDITLTLSIVSTNYTLASNTFTLTNGKITPAEFTVTASMFDGLFKTEKTYDGNTNVYDNSDKAINTNNPVDYKESGQTIFKVTAAQYKNANADEQKDITLTLGIVSANYTLASNTFTLKNGKITPAELSLTFAAEDFNNIIELQRQFNADDPSAKVKTNEITKGDNTFIIKSAEYKENTVGDNKEIVITVELNDPNFTLKNPTFSLTNGTIWDYAAIDLNDLEFNEGSAEIGKDITASATYNGEPVAGTFTYTPSAGTQLTKGTHTVKVEFAPQSSYIKAPATVPSFDVKVKGVIVVDQNSIRQKDNLDAYCLDAVGNLMLEYSKVIGNIKTYQIEVEGFESLSQSGDIADGSVIYITLPADVLPGRYNGTIQFFGENEESDKYPFTIDIYLPRDIVKQLYSDVLFADNHESLYVGYQWFKNGNAIGGADKQFYHEAGLDLSNKYTVEVKTKSGISLHSCPLDAANAVTKRALSDVKVYPNPAKAGIPFTLELVGGDNDFSDTEIQIYNNSGTLVQRVTNVDKTITLTLPRGNYSGALIRHGEKSGFKIIVE